MIQTRYTSFIPVDNYSACGQSVKAKYRLFCLFLILALLYQPACANLVRTVGYTAGRLSAINLERTFNSAYIGELLLGRDSATYVSVGNRPVHLFANPWQFCFDRDRYEEIEAMIGKDVVLEFKTPKKHALLSCSAASELLTIYPVATEWTREQTYLTGRIRSTEPEISRGIDFGRITNVVENKDALRNYFITIQIGNGGSQFRHFIVDDPNLFDFAISCLQTAATVRVHYSERYIGNNHSASYVREIEIVD